MALTLRPRCAALPGRCERAVPARWPDISLAASRSNDQWLEGRRGWLSGQSIANVVRLVAQDVAPSGLVAGKYRLTNLIGRGGMGSVWEGTHVTLGTQVAVKFIDSEYAESPEARNR